MCSACVTRVYVSLVSVCVSGKPIMCVCVEDNCVAGSRSTNINYEFMIRYLLAIKTSWRQLTKQPFFPLLPACSLLPRAEADALKRR